jgi:hypothetical protein
MRVRMRGARDEKNDGRARFTVRFASYRSVFQTSIRRRPRVRALPNGLICDWQPLVLQD